MSDRIVNHSSRYKGPAGDSRPAAEIFAGIEAREVENDAVQKELIAAIENTLSNRKLASFEGRIQLIRNTFVDWLFENDPTLEHRKDGEKNV